VKGNQVPQVVSQVSRSLADQFEKFGGASAKSQLTGQEGVLGIGKSAPQIPNPDKYDDLEVYRAKIEADNQRRIDELRAFIRRQMDAEEEQKRARMKMEEEAKRFAEIQSQAMGRDKEEDKNLKGGVLPALGRFAKGLKGRLGFVGKGKMEKGKAAMG